MLFNIDWQLLTDNLDPAQGEVRSYSEKFYRNEDGRFNHIIDLWQTAGYDKTGTVEWINFYPSKHFDNSVIEQFEIFSNTKCARAWISCIRPGKMAPYHQDIDDNEELYLKQGDLVRFTVNACEPSNGQLFIVENKALYNQPQGTVYEWPHYLAWHAGGNCSFKPKFLFNFLGIKK
jgi:hypothetical protein